MGNPAKTKKIERLNKQIKELIKKLAGELTEIRRDRLTMKLQIVNYALSELVELEKLDSEIDPQGLVDKMIAESILDSLDWMILKKKKKYKIQNKNSHQIELDRLKESLYWIMDDEPDTGEEVGLTFLRCCTIMRTSPANIRYCLYAASKRKLKEIISIRQQFVSPKEKEKKEIPVGNMVDSLLLMLPNIIQPEGMPSFRAV